MIRYAYKPKFKNEFYHCVSNSLDFYIFGTQEWGGSFEPANAKMKHYRLRGLVNAFLVIQKRKIRNIKV